MDQKPLLKFGAFAAAFTTFTLAVMLFIPWPFEFEFPGRDVLIGQASLSAREFALYVKTIRLFYCVDTMFIIGWIISWIGLAALVKQRNNFLGNIALWFGLTAAGLDLTENQFIWSMIQTRLMGLPVSADWGMGWQIVRELSFLLTFISAFLLSLGLWQEKFPGKLMAVVGTVGLIPAVAGLYVPCLAMASNFWYGFWFIGATILLFRAAKQI